MGRTGQDVNVQMSTLSPTSTSISTRRSRGARSLATQLERDRLEQRAARVKQVLAALRERADARNGTAPKPLRAAIEDFGRELADIERQMRHVGAR